jgi:hypothetical protein
VDQLRGEDRDNPVLLALIRDAGHFAAFTQPDRFLAELVTHVRPLATVASPPSTR